jgi:hypothetical protein
MNPKNESDIRSNGFVKGPDGIWSKPPRIREPVVGLPNPQPEHREIQTLESRPQKQARGKKGVVRCVVQIVSYRTRELDDDNCTGGSKAMRDAIAESLGIDDGDRRIRFEVSQVIGTAVGTHVLITTP